MCKFFAFIRYKFYTFRNLVKKKEIYNIKFNTFNTIVLFRTFKK